MDDGNAGAQALAEVGALRQVVRVLLAYLPPEAARSAVRTLRQREGEPKPPQSESAIDRLCAVIERDLRSRDPG